jgi:dihydroxyacetone kinase
MLARILSKDTGYLDVCPGEQAALLVNNLGTTTPMELQIVARAALRQLEQQHRVCPDAEMCVSRADIAPC